MNRTLEKPFKAAPASALLLLVAVLVAACGGSGENRQAQRPEAAPLSTVAEPPERGRNSDEGAADESSQGGTEQGPEAGSEGQRGDSRGERRAVQRVASRYVDALSRGDGELVCRSLAAGAVDAVELPKQRSDCAASLTASIGFRDPRGVPVFAGAELVAFEGLEIDANEARVTATVVTDFADRDEPSIEDDVIYLTRLDGGWLIAKASPTLYRAIGAASVPPDALSPPE